MPDVAFEDRAYRRVTLRLFPFLFLCYAAPISTA